MIRYRYAAQLQPPAPFVNVTLRCHDTERQISNLPALLDTAADRTVLPRQLIEALGLVEDGRVLFQGFAGEVVELPIFLVEAQVHDLQPLLVRAALGEREPYILLGRDLLNRLWIQLDGPQGILDLDCPSAAAS
jgi:predicted aspartyl protease